MFRKTRAQESVPEYRPGLDDGAGGHDAARGRIIGVARATGNTIPPDRPLLTRGQRANTRHPEAGIHE